MCLFMAPVHAVSLQSYIVLTVYLSVFHVLIHLVLTVTLRSITFR